MVNFLYWVVKHQLIINYEITKDKTNKKKSSDLLKHYNDFNDIKTDAKKLKQMKEYNRFKYIK